MRSSLIAVSLALAVLLLAPGPALANTVSLTPSDSAVYSYEIFTTYATPNGNFSSSIMNQFALWINAVNATGPVGEAAYTENLTVYNSTVVNPPLTNRNVTSIFDPFNNLTYWSQPWIGWYPFTYTDLHVGKVVNMGVNVTVTGIPTGTGNATQSGIERVNATISRSPGLINVNFTMGFGVSPGQTSQNSTFALTTMSFNSTTGWLISRVTYANAFGVEKIFTYKL
ncbi:MAG: hypothetical protein ABR867_05765, partial [Nitrososphaerales archaeon]